MPAAKNGDSVKVNYTGKLNDGTVFDSSQDREPMRFTVGSRQLIPGFEDAVSGMQTGDSATVKIPADKAYGPHQQDLIMTLNRDQLPPEYQPSEGDVLQSQADDGRPMMAKVIEVREKELKVDANHPLAGEDLTFEIELVEIEE
ncbi:FKBP-type 16 kDa peptidyl-prolyl cis-trans isomerase [bacterium BMS3Abin01]|nr:FKBP-type 16 kDa peptidyl-prolyl cis-trans isomerase [bacterium BMS3Abin01]